MKIEMLAPPALASAPRLSPRPGRNPASHMANPERMSDRSLTEIFDFGSGSPASDEPMVSAGRAMPKIALIGGFTPRRCGIATFTADTYASIKAAFPAAVVDVYAMAPVANDIGFVTPVCATIVENDSGSFIVAAAAIEASRADVIWLQHEFGLFGGYAGDKILELLDRVAAPLIITLHTVMPDPDPDQLRVMQRMVARASKLVVMSDRAALLLRSVYGADADQIELIPHGVPDRPFGRAEHFKRKFNLQGRQVLMTFGLLSPGKGIEVAIAALPEITARHPGVVYCIVGATHPNLLATEGEAYRRRLQDLAAELGVESHIQWVDEFLETDTLLDWIEAADIYLTLYLGANQATSGTLSYALALGKAIVSTPYAHAVELLADDHGVLVQFNDCAALAAEIDALLDHPERLRALQVRAYQKGRDMTWPSFAARCLDVIDAVRVDTRPETAEHPIAAQPLDGFLRMCDDTGILQHSVFSVPDRAHGYCVDDNARALMLMNRLDCQDSPERERLTAIFAAFVESSWNEQTREFRNFMGYARNWLEAAGSEDSCGRTLWALGATTLEGRTPQLRRWAVKLFDHSAPSARDFRSPRAQAFATLGADHLLASDPGHDMARATLSNGAEFIHARLVETRRQDWPWFETVLAYDNCRLPEAMIRAGLRLERPEFVHCGLEALTWIMTLQTSPSGCFRPIGSESFGFEFAAPRPFDQQPVEAWAAIDAARAAFDATRDPIWLGHANRAYAWFTGTNDRGVAVADPLAGSCHDGINPRGLNFNEGAESILAFLLASCAIKALVASSRLS